MTVIGGPPAFRLGYASGETVAGPPEFLATKFKVEGRYPSFPAKISVAFAQPEEPETSPNCDVLLDGLIGSSTMIRNG